MHIIGSVGWIGAAAAYLALGVAAGAARKRTRPFRAAWIGMELIRVVRHPGPFAISALLTGVLLALATPWGLFRHYSGRHLPGPDRAVPRPR